MSIYIKEPLICYSIAASFPSVFIYQLCQYLEVTRLCFSRNEPLHLDITALGISLNICGPLLFVYLFFPHFLYTTHDTMLIGKYLICLSY